MNITLKLMQWNVLVWWIVVGLLVVAIGTAANAK